jgi:hypothetical protein
MTGTESAARARASTAIITALFIFIIYPSPIVFGYLKLMLRVGSQAELNP